MATKAQSFRARAQREAHPPVPKKPVRTKVVSTNPDASKNASIHAGRRGGAIMEESANGKPSRKSTRGSADHTKQTTNLQLRETRKLAAPSTRASAKPSVRSTAAKPSARANARAVAKTPSRGPRQ